MVNLSKQGYCIVKQVKIKRTLTLESKVEEARQDELVVEPHLCLGRWELVDRVGEVRLGSGCRRAGELVDSDLKHWKAGQACWPSVE